MAESAPKRKGGRGLWVSLCALGGKELELSPFIRLNDGLRGAAILRLWQIMSTSSQNIRRTRVGIWTHSAKKDLVDSDDT